MSGVGDVLWTTPLLSNLRSAYPQAQISCLVRDFCAPVLFSNPDLDRLVVFTKGRLSGQIKFLKELKDSGYDLTIDLVGTPRTAIHSLATGAAHRIGFDFGYRRLFYNHVLDARAANSGHEVEFNLSVLGYLGAAADRRDLVFNLTDSELEYQQHLYQEMNLAGREVVGLIPTGGWSCKRWPIEYYIEVARALSSSQNRRILVFWGSRAEEKDANTICQTCPPARAIPRTSLRQMAALLSGCRLIIGNDSGPLHIATALKLPVLSFYGPTVPRSQGPWGQPQAVLQAPDLGCLGCNRIQCPDPKCMTGIRPDRVIETAEQMLAGAHG
jgi:lipopolysaccharide heptosyltransferase II